MLAEKVAESGRVELAAGQAYWSVIKRPKWDCQFSHYDHQASQAGAGKAAPGRSVSGTLDVATDEAGERDTATPD